MIALLILLALFGMPLFAIVALVALLGYQEAGMDGIMVILEFLRVQDKPLLPAIPLFLFAGFLLAESRAPERLLALGRIMPTGQGWGIALPGMALGTVLVAWTGAGGFALIVLGSALIPALLQSGLSRTTASGAIRTGAGAGILLAPALPLIVYATSVRQVAPASRVTLDQMYLAGVLPGLLVLAVVAATAAWLSRGRALVPASTTSNDPAMPSRRRTLVSAAGELPLPLIILVGIYTGWLLVTEAALIAAAGAIIQVCLIRREVQWARLVDIVGQSMILAGAVLLLVGLSIASASYLVDAGVPAAIHASLPGYLQNPHGFLLLVNGMLLVVGALMNINAALVIFTPLIVPLAIHHGIDPVHMGVMMVVNLYVASHLLPDSFGTRSEERGGTRLFRSQGIAAYLPGLLIVLALVILVPGSSLWLAR